MKWKLRDSKTIHFLINNWVVTLGWVVFILGALGGLYLCVGVMIIGGAKQVLLAGDTTSINIPYLVIGMLRVMLWFIGAIPGTIAVVIGTYLIGEGTIIKRERY